MKVIKDQKGFTIIELITSFSLTMVVLVFLFNIVVIMKETYVVNAAKSDLIITQSLLTTALNEDLYNNMKQFYISSNSSGQNKQYRIYFKDGSNTYLKVLESSDQIVYKGIVYGGDDFDIVSHYVCKGEYSGVSQDLDSYLKIHINVKSKLVPDYDFNIDVVQLYNTASVNTYRAGTGDIPNCST